MWDAYKLISSVIPKEQLDKQNKLINDILLSKNKIKVINAPTGFGKSFIYLAEAKSLDNSIIFTATTTITNEIFNANRLTQFNNPSDKKVGFVIGKGSKSPVMCPFYQQYYKGRERKESVHNFCDRMKKSCLFNNNMTEDTKDSTYTLKPSIRSAIIYDLSLINSKVAENENLTLSKVVGTIIGRLWCPYYYLKNMARFSDVVVCDFQYFINQKYIESINIKANTTHAIIDEYDVLENRLERYMNASLALKQLEKSKKSKLLESIKEKDVMLYGFIFDFLSLFIFWLEEKGKKIDKKNPMIDLKKEFIVDKRLKQCIELFSHLSDNYSDFCKTRITEGKDGLSALLRFFESREEIYEMENQICFIDYIEKDEDIFLIRKTLSFESFFKRKRNFYKTLTIGSATLPPNQLLISNLGNDLKIFNVDWKLKNRKGIIFKSNDFDLSQKKIQNGFTREIIKPLIDIIQSTREKAIVIFIKSNSILNNDKRYDVFKEIFRKEKIKLFNIQNTDKENEGKCWEDFYNYTKRRKGVMICSAHSKYGRGVNNLGGDYCRLLIIWGIPIEHIPEKIVQNAYEKLFQKQNIGFNFNQFHFCLKVRKLLKQVIGRLVRNHDDYGFFIILADKRIEKILPLDIQEDLGMFSVTENIESAKVCMEQFFKNIRGGYD